MPKTIGKNSEFRNKLAILLMKCIKSVNQNKKVTNKKIVQLIENALYKKGSKLDQRSPDLSNFRTYFNKRFKCKINLFFILINTSMKKDDLLEKSSLSIDTFIHAQSYFLTDRVLLVYKVFIGLQPDSGWYCE